MGQINKFYIFYNRTFFIFFKKMILKKNHKIPLDKFIDYCLYDKKNGYYMKKIHLEKKVILQLHQIFQDYFLK